MKVILFWTVAWAFAVTADRPCAEYCEYLLSGIHHIEFQPECNCLYDVNVYQKKIDDSSIYYEPINYAPLPVYSQNEPFYIPNPVILGRTSGNNPGKLNTFRPSLQLHSHDITMEINIENGHSPYKRHEKDVQSNKQTVKAPLYLDIDVIYGDVERSASTKSFTAEELNLTEQRLLECTNLYTALHSRKNSKMKDKLKMYLFKNYSNLSNEELEKNIQNKCSHISYIIEESLNEIKKTRSKLASATYRTDDDDQLNNKKSHNNNNYYTTENALCTSVTENNLQSTVQSESKEQVTVSTVKYTESGAETLDILNSTSNKLNTTPINLNTLSSEVSPTDTATISAGEIQNSSDAHITTQYVSTEVSESIKVQNTTPMPIQSETSLHTTTLTFEGSTSVEKVSVEESTIKLEVTKEKRTDDEVSTATTSANERQSENRARYKESEVPPVKIVTHEYSNDTVQSFINGTEDIPNGDFNDELKPFKNDLSTPLNSEDDGVTARDITGKLYFYFNKHHVPAKFIQNSNGSIHLGVDGVKLCNTLTQNDDQNSVFLTSLCNCYKSGHCGHNNTD